MSPNVLEPVSSDWQLSAPPHADLAQPEWRGEALPGGRALLVDASGGLADALAALGAVAATARRGHRVMLSPQRAHSVLLARAWGVWAVWPREDRQAHTASHIRGPDSADADSTPRHPLLAAVGASCSLSSLAHALGPEPGRFDMPVPHLAPRLHLPLDVLGTARHAVLRQGWLPSREGLLGWWLRDLPPPPRLRVSGLRHAVWSVESSLADGDIGFEPLQLQTIDWLQRAAEIAQLDHLLTDDSEAAALALALGRPVSWLGASDTLVTQEATACGEPLCRANPQALQRAFVDELPARLGTLRELSLDDPAAVLHELVAASQHRSVAVLHDACTRLLVAHPQRPDAWRLLGTLSTHLQQPALALGCHLRVTEIAPTYADGWRSLGLLLADRGAVESGAEALCRALTLNPQDDAVRHRLAALRAQAGRPGKAVTLIRPLAAHQPSNWKAQLDLGLWLLDDDQPDAAVPHLHAALAGTPTDTTRSLRALPRLAEALKRQGDLEGSGACLRQWLQLAPDDLEANLALARHDRNGRQADRALQQMAPLVAANPQDPRVALEWLFSRRLALDWTALNAQQPSADQALESWIEATDTVATTQARSGSAKGSSPASASALAFDAIWMLAETATETQLSALARSSWVAASHSDSAYASRSPNAGHGAARSTARHRARIRVRYAGSREAVHRHARLLSDLLEHHDRDRHQIDVCCWTRRSSDAMREDEDFDALVDTLGEVEALHDASDRGIAERLRADAVDIMINLDGCGPHARPGIWRHHPARRQLGWLDTLIDRPMPGHDAVLTDADPAPGLLHVGGGAIAIAPRPSMGLAAGSPERRAYRRVLGLPDQAPVIAALAPHEQIDPLRWAAWMSCLQACPPAHLWLDHGPVAQQRRLQAAAEAAGVRKERLHFMDPSSQPAGALATIDLYLCTRLEGHGQQDTLLEALASAVPALCTVGTGPASRLAASMLRRAGQAHGVSHDDAELIAQALALLRAPRELLKRRAELIDAHRSAPLFDIKRLARSLETAFGHCLGREP